MTVEALSTTAWTLASEGSPRQEKAYPNERLPATRWDEDTFAQEQIRGLVRQVFSRTVKPTVKQVVFCPVDAESDVQSLCSWVAEVLAQEKQSEVALLDESDWGTELAAASEDGQHGHRTASVRQFGARIRCRMWWFPARHSIPEPWRASLSAYLAELRKEFEYSIVAAPAPTVSSKALELAASADGVVLVLSARRTRRVTALKVKSVLGQIRLLGTVLSDREFPIPARIYRRL